MRETLYVYRNLMSVLINGLIDLDDDDIKLMLVGGSYAPNVLTHSYKSDIIGEISGENYTPGGVSLTGKNFTVNNNIGTFRADDVTFPAMVVEGVRYGIIYDNTPAKDAEKPLLAYIDFKEEFKVNNANLDVIWSSDGILKVTTE